MLRVRRIAAVALVAVLAPGAVRVAAQAPTRTAVLIAEDRRAETPRDLAVIRGGLHSSDPETVRVAARALGRLERPDLIADLVPLLKAPVAEIRAETANAIGQAAQGWKTTAPVRTPAVHRTGTVRAPVAPTIDAVAMALTSRLGSEEDAMVRGVLCQTLGRLPYTTGEQAQKAESTLTETLAHEDSTDGRLGIAQGLEAWVRLNQKLVAPASDTVARLIDLASGAGTNGAARVRRLALEALISADGVTDTLLARAASDSDAQLRRLAMRAASGSKARHLEHADQLLEKGTSDPAPMVRYEALHGRAVRAPSSEVVCAASLAATTDADQHVALLGIDQLSACSAAPDAVTALERLVNDLPQAPGLRAWHRPAHAIVALAGAAPDKARAALPAFVASSVWQLRMYAARAAAVLSDRATLEKLAADPDDNVAEAAVAGLSKVAGHAADPVYVAALSRRGYQAVREAARALGADRQNSNDQARSSDAQASVAALSAAYDRLTTEGHDNSRDARTAIAATLERFGAPVKPMKPVREMAIESPLTAEDLRQFASARARVTIRGVGVFELALFTSQAPATAVHIARLARSGYYDGLTFHRVVPNFVIQGGSPGANEYVGEATYMRDEVGLWPHVRGAVGISTRGRDTGDAQIFVDLVDNPRLDHEYTVFAQVLTGMDVVDRILEGDVIDKVEILTP